MRRARIGWITGLVAVLSIGLDAYAQTRPKPASYWSRRHAVVLEVTWGPTFRFEQARIVENYARDGLADSLLEAARMWPLPEWIRQPALPQKYSMCVAQLTDRTESTLPATAHLHAEVMAVLSKGLFAEWMRAIQSVDSLASFADFTLSSREAVYRLSEQYLDLLNAREMKSKRDFGLLHPSPDNRWVLDPFQGMDVDSTGHLMSDVDTGFEIYDSKTGGRILHYVTTTNGILFATWNSDSTFCLVGSGHVDPGSSCRVPIWAPKVWIVDVRSAILREYMGAPLSPWKVASFWDSWRELQRKAYPKLRSRP